MPARLEIHDGRTTWARELQSALVALGGDEETFLRLSYFAGLDQAGIARATGASLLAVASSLALGLQRLAATFEVGPAGPLDPGPVLPLGV